jgi:hypothetical protein
MSDVSTPTPLVVISRVLEWFNSLSEPGAVATRADVEQRFTADARMLANNQLKCQGIEGHYKHFVEIRSKLKSWRVRLPFEIAVSEADRVAAYYLIEYVTVDGSRGIVHDMAFWTVRDGKIASMTELVHFEGVDVALENHS